MILRGGVVATGFPVTIRQADIRILSGRIIHVGSDINTEDLNEEVIDCSGTLITPGLINGHVHLNQVLNRGLLDDRDTEELLEAMHARHSSKSDDDRYWGSLLSIYEGLRSGTTYFSAFATSMGLIGKALTDSGVRGTITVAKKDQWWGKGRPPEQKGTTEILQHLKKIVKEFHHPKISLSIGAASDRSASHALLQGIADLSAECGTRVFIHTAEGQTAVDLSLEHRGLRPVEFLDRIGFLTNRTTLVHCSRIDTTEVEIISRSGASVCHCPVSNSKTVAGTMPLNELTSSRVAVCLGTDAASTGNTNNILLEGYAASLIHRAVFEDATFPSADLIFALLTVQGARAVGCEGEIGEIKPGLRADLVVWDLGQSAFLPHMANPISTLIYCASEVQAKSVYIDGELVFSDTPLYFDLAEVISKVREYGEGGV